MPRPFALIGLTVFFVLSLLSNASAKTVFAVFIFFTFATMISVIIKKIRRQPVFQVAFAGAAVACLLLLAVNEFYCYPALKIADTSHDCTFLITDESEYLYGNYYYKAKLKEIDGDKVGYNIRLAFNDKPDIEPYEEISGQFYFYKLGESSETRWSSYKSENMFLGAYPLNENYNINNTSSHHIGKLIMSVRSYIKREIMTVLPNDYGALSLALLLGEKDELSNAAYDSIRGCGAAHIICVSGLHLSLWASAILWLLQKLRFSEKIAAALTIPGVIFLMLVTGMTNSVVRAGIMMIVYLISVILSQRHDSLNSLGVALIIISVVNPYACGSVSLQLSALATLGIILSNQYVLPEFRESIKGKKLIGFFSKPVSLLIITLSAVAFTLPVTLSTYGSINLCVFPSNLIIVLLAEICMISSAMAVVMGSMGIAFNLPALFSGIVSKCILSLSDIFSASYLSRIAVSEKEAYSILCAIFSFLALCMLVAYTGLKVFKPAVIIGTAMLIISLSFYSYTNSKQTFVTVFDEGETNAVFVSHGKDSVLIGLSGDYYDSTYNICNNIVKQNLNPSLLIIPDSEKEESFSLHNAVNHFKFDKVLCPDPDYQMKILFDEKTILNDSYIESGSFTVTSYSDGSGNTAYYIKDNNLNLLIISSDEFDTSYLTEDALAADSVICKGDLSSPVMFSDLKLFVAETNDISVQTKLKSQGVPAVATADNGNIRIICKNHNIKAERG